MTRTKELREAAQLVLDCNDDAASELVARHVLATTRDDDGELPTSESLKELGAVECECGLRFQFTERARELLGETFQSGNGHGGSQRVIAWSVANAVVTGLLAENEMLRRRLPQPITAESEFIDIDPLRMGGVPCIKGHRITVAQFLATLAEGKTIHEFADDFDILPAMPTLVGIVNMIASAYSNPFSGFEGLRALTAPPMAAQNSTVTK